MTESEIKLVERLWESGKGVGEIARQLTYKEYIAKREIAELKKKGVLNGQKEVEPHNITLNNIALKPLEEFAGSIKCKSLRSLI